MKTARIFIVSLVWGMFLVIAAIGQDVPQLINYQGNLLKDGQPYEGYEQITFSIYNVMTGATPLWSESQSVKVTRGYYNVLLGGVTSFPDTLFAGAERYLGIKVGTEEEMTPRIRIASVGFALNADRLDGQDASIFVSTVENLRIIRGTVNSDGTIAAGSGFSVTKQGTGEYLITFTQAFSARPSGSVAQVYPNLDDFGAGGSTLDNALFTGIDSIGAKVITGGSTGTRLDRYFTFIIIGPR